MAESEVSSEIPSEEAIPFRFEITWRSVTEPPKPTALEAVAPVSRREPGVNPEAREWEMILPRMKRPAALAGVTAEESGNPSPIAAPQFSFATESLPVPRWAIFALAGLLVVGVGGYQWLRQDGGAVASAVGTEVGGTGWITEWASDYAGSARARQLSLYRPSRSMSDYNLEFLGRIERRSLGWVFRAADSSNYYAAKLEAVQAGTSQLAITRFAVVHGVEGPHIQRDIPFEIAPTDMLKVRLEARGPRFTIWVQNRVVEDWEDEELKTGGLGFLNERQERGQIASLQISFPKGGTRR